MSGVVIDNASILSSCARGATDAHSEEKMTPDGVYKAVVEFFTSRADQQTGPSKASYSSPAHNTCLLQIACMGNAEKTVQGEMVAYLRSKQLFAVSEAGFRISNPILNLIPRVLDRHIDIMVYDGGYSPIAAIEIKHYSPHQGDIAPYALTKFPTPKFILLIAPFFSR